MRGPSRRWIPKQSTISVHIVLSWLTSFLLMVGRQMTLRALWWPFAITTTSRKIHWSRLPLSATGGLGFAAHREQCVEPADERDDYTTMTCSCTGWSISSPRSMEDITVRWLSACLLYELSEGCLVIPEDQRSTTGVLLPATPSWRRLHLSYSRNAWMTPRCSTRGFAAPAALRSGSPWTSRERLSAAADDPAALSCMVSTSVVPHVFDFYERDGNEEKSASDPITLMTESCFHISATEADCERFPDSEEVLRGGYRQGKGMHEGLPPLLRKRSISSNGKWEGEEEEDILHNVQARLHSSLFRYLQNPFNS